MAKAAGNPQASATKSPTRLPGTPPPSPARGTWLLMTALIVEMTPTVATNLAVRGGLVAVFVVVSALSA
jgi:hypothetical protein